MKQTILIILCFFFAFSSLQAQTNLEVSKAKKTTFGLRLGYELQLNNSNLNYTLKLPYLGLLSEISLNNKWSLQLELNLRSEKREELFNNGSKFSIDELYLTVPVMLKYKMDRKFKLYAGTQVLSASLVNNIFGLKKWNGILGVEYNVFKNIFMDARFRHGFEERNSNNNFRDNRLSIGIGYKF